MTEVKETLFALIINIINRNNELSRNRTYIRNLEGFCPDPLDDEPFALVLMDLAFAASVDHHLC